MEPAEHRQPAGREIAHVVAHCTWTAYGLGACMLLTYRSFNSPISGYQPCYQRHGSIAGYRLKGSSATDLTAKQRLGSVGWTRVPLARHIGAFPTDGP